MKSECYLENYSKSKISRKKTNPFFGDKNSSFQIFVQIAFALQKVSDINISFRPISTLVRRPRGKFTFGKSYFLIKLGYFFKDLKLKLGQNIA